MLYGSTIDIFCMGAQYRCAVWEHNTNATWYDTLQYKVIRCHAMQYSIRNVMVKCNMIWWETKRNDQFRICNDTNVPMMSYQWSVQDLQWRQCNVISIDNDQFRICNDTNVPMMSYQWSVQDLQWRQCDVISIDNDQFRTCDGTNVLVAMISSGDAMWQQCGCTVPYCIPWPHLLGKADLCNGRPSNS